MPGGSCRSGTLDVLVVAEGTVPEARKASARLRGALRGLRMCTDILEPTTTWERARFPNPPAFDLAKNSVNDYQVVQRYWRSF